MAAGAGSVDGGGRAERLFVIMRQGRIRTWSHVWSLRRHNVREMDCPNVEKDAPPPVLLVGDADVAGAIRRVLKVHGIEPAAGAVLAIEIVITTSPQFFEGIDATEHARRLLLLVERSMKALRERFTIEGQIVMAALHLDETTPHLHVAIVPLVMKADRRRADRSPHVRLSAKAVIGGRGDMAREQTRFAKFFDDTELQRGRERSGKAHVPNRENAARLAAARRQALEERDGLRRDREAMAADVAELREAIVAHFRDRAAFEEEMAAARSRIDAGRLASERVQAAVEATADQLRHQAQALDRDRERLASGWATLGAAQGAADTDRVELDRRAAELTVQRAQDAHRSAIEDERLRSEREGLALLAAEAEALKARALKRIASLEPVLRAAQRFVDRVNSVEAAKRTASQSRTLEYAVAIETARASAVANDAYLAQQLARASARAGRG